MASLDQTQFLLKSGDRVSIIAPASQFRGADRHLLGLSIELLQSWGLEPVVRVEHDHHFYLAGPDAIRTRHLQDALMAEDEKAIFCTRGGYGLPRLLRSLEGLSPSSKIIVGYSDITALHLASANMWPDVRIVHGPNIATIQLLGDTPECEFNRNALRECLFVGGPFQQEDVDFLKPGKARGPLVGGCLSLVSSVVGTPFAPLTEGAILFLEDTGEPPYRIDRMITQIRNAGHLDNVAGLIFGPMHKCTDPYNDLKAVIRDLLDDVAFPVAFGLKSGHGPINYSLRLGQIAELNSQCGGFTLG